MASAEQKMLELKKAYADVILNTTKEAAARVLAAEKKAMRFQYELESSKKEAVRLLVRQKQNMDAKINEAEMKSLSQQKIIDELEAQLHEAEDIVRDLREELRQTKSALEKIAYKQLHSNGQISKPIACVQEETSQEDKVNNTSQPVNINSTVNQNNEEYKNPHTENHHIFNPDFPFPSILMRNKDPELYRNGCTQRIRAFERELMDIKLTLSGQIDDLEDERGIKGNEEAEDNSCAMEKREEDGSCDLMQGVKCIFPKRKRAARCRKSSFCEASKLSFSETSAVPVDNNVHSGETTFVIEDNEAQNDMKSGCAKDDETNTTFIKPCSVQRTPFLARHEGGSSETSETFVCKTDDAKSDGFLAKSGTETTATDLVCSQLGNDKFLKYTFTRKRKKGWSLSNQDFNESPEESSSKQKIGERPNDHAGPHESSSNGLKQMTGEDQIACGPHMILA